MVLVLWNCGLSKESFWPILRLTPPPKFDLFLTYFHYFGFRTLGHFSSFRSCTGTKGWCIFACFDEYSDTR